LTTYFVVFPVVGAGLGGLFHRFPHAQNWVRPPGFFAAEPASPDQRDELERRRGRFVRTGSLAGIVIALVTTALDFLWRGWPFLDRTLIPGLIFFPYFGALLGFNLSLRPGDPKPSLRDIRFRTRTWMLLIAHLGLVLGLGTEAVRASRTAAQYDWKCANAERMVEVFGQLRDRTQRDVKRRANADALRRGQIPDAILPSQKTFLKSLDTSANAEYRKYRYGLIADTEERLATFAEKNVDLYDRLIDHHRQLAAKYRKAAQEPWIPVSPDPPMPK
jgi:hypothetical protein